MRTEVVRGLLPGMFAVMLLVGPSACSTSDANPGASASATTVGGAARLDRAPDPQREGFELELARAYPAGPGRAAGTRRFDLRAAPSTVPLFDGRPVEVWAYNGQVPGPVLRVRLGETVEVLFRNGLPQPTTVHWHGVRVPNAMDGVPGVTQPAVPPGGTFVYRFVPKDAGTFWFHPHFHSAEQIERGLYGVLIVDDAETLPYTRDEVWVLDDWRLNPSGEIDPRFVTRHDLAHDGRWGQVVTVNGDASHELSARPGERLRIRMVNTSNGRVYRPGFGHLSAQVIAVDGMYTARPLQAGSLDLAPGNRIDVDVSIPSDLPAGAYLIIDHFPRVPHTLARVIVAGAPVPQPTFEPPSNPLFPQWRDAAERPVDLTYVLAARRGGVHGIEWTLNDQAWEQREAALLEGGRWLRVRFENASGRLHPMHIHGQFFRVIARDGRAVDEPFLRDTVLVRGRESVDIGIVPTDWGRWMMHCHILEHAESGMMTEVVVGTAAHDASAAY